LSSKYFIDFLIKKLSAKLNFLEQNMPVISRFFGIVIIMYWNDHNPPHIHAKYGEYNAIISISGEFLGGDFPHRASALVLEWIRRHTSELLDNWQRAASGEPIRPIEPLE